MTFKKHRTEPRDGGLCAMSQLPQVSRGRKTWISRKCVFRLDGLLVAEDRNERVEASKNPKRSQDIPSEPNKNIKKTPVMLNLTDLFRVLMELMDLDNP